jgi:ketosteroid isomerase-like protein
MVFCTMRITRAASLIALGLLLSLNPGVSRAADTAAGDDPLHQDLRALKDRATNAVNKRDEGALIKELDPTIAFTAMNNETVRGLDAARTYYERMMAGSERIVQDMSVTIEPDALSTLYNGGTTAVATGGSNAHFKLKTGMEFDVPLRWTATLIRSQDHWLLAAMHFSANMFDNPILAGLERTMIWATVGAAVVALLVGFFVGRQTRRRA